MTNPDRLADATGGRGGRAAGVPSNPKTEGSPGKLAGPNGVPAAVANHPIPAQAGDTAARVARAEHVDVSSVTDPAGSAPTARPAGDFRAWTVTMPVTLRLHPVRACRRCQCDFVPADDTRRLCQDCVAAARAAGHANRQPRRA